MAHGLEIQNNLAVPLQKDQSLLNTLMLNLTSGSKSLSFIGNLLTEPMS